MKKGAFLSLVFLVLGCFHLGAQGDYRKDFDEFTKQVKQSHSAFTDTVNVIFAKALGAVWEQYDLSDGNNRQDNPEPESIPIAESGQSHFKIITVSETVDTIPSHWLIETGEVLRVDDTQESRVVKFVFYDSEQVVSVPRKYGSFHPKGISETDVASFWEELSKYDYTCIVSDCARYAKAYGYNDWAILEWVQLLSSTIFPRNLYSEQTIFSVFLLNQIGLMTRLARADDKLVSIFSSMQPVYARKFLIIDTYPYYLAEKNFSANTVYTYNADFIKPARPLDLRISTAISFGKPDSFITSHKHSALFNTSFDLPINQALIRFYANYPQTAVSVYATAQPDPRFSRALTSTISESIKGLPELDAVNQLLAFVQTDFGYKTDLVQFGFEKPFFCEENFIYGNNDCEDRAALFAFLVMNLLGLKVVLLDYPDHLSSAVRLSSETKGDYLRIGNDKYYVCDPSYIGATLGMTITKYKNTSVKVYVL